MTTWTSPRPRLVSLHLWAYRHRVAILAGIGSFLFVGLLSLAYFTRVVVTRFDGRRWNLPSRIYSDVAVWHVGDGGSADRLARKLERLLYQESFELPKRPGWFRRAKSGIAVWTRDFRYPGRSPSGQPVRVEYSGNTVKSIASFTGERLGALIVEPERLGSVYGEEFEDRTVIRLSEAPRALTDAILVTEDRD